MLTRDLFAVDNLFVECLRATVYRWDQFVFLLFFCAACIASIICLCLVETDALEKLVS